MREEIITFFLAMTPTVEAHGAITAGIVLFKFSPLKAFLLAVTGTVAVIPIIIFFLHRLSKYLMARIYVVNRFLAWLFSYTRRRHTDHFSDSEEVTSIESGRRRFLKALALFLFVAFPGPLTGVWGGGIAAFVFGIPFWDSVIALALGAVAVAALDTLIIGGIVHIVR